MWCVFFVGGEVCGEDKLHISWCDAIGAKFFLKVKVNKWAIFSYSLIWKTEKFSVCDFFCIVQRLDFFAGFVQNV